MKKLYYEYEDGRYRYWKPRMFFGDVTVSPNLPAYQAIRIWSWDSETNEIVTIKSQTGDEQIDENDFLLIQLVATELLPKEKTLLRG